MKQNPTGSHGRLYTVTLSVVIIALSLVAVLLSALIVLMEINTSDTPETPDTPEISDTKEPPVTTTLPEGAIGVLSNYPGLHYLVPGEFDHELRYDGTVGRAHPMTYVGLVSNQLSVLSNHGIGNSPIPHVSESVEYRFEDFCAGRDGIFLNGTKFIDADCVGMIPASDGKTVLFVTRDSENSTLFFAKRGDDGWTLLDRTVAVEGRVLLVECNWGQSFGYTLDKVHLITDRNVTVLHIVEYFEYENGTVDAVRTEVIAVPAWWHEIMPTSAVLLPDGTLFIGEKLGVIGIKDGVVTAYPVDFLGYHYSH
ncbi:MAG: hypothetical protein IKC63_03320 [Clostridia bacterium]|nr:hypothetical protein [Clostridia bacterium]